jgi:primosomal protein N' (replication factor Y)
VVAAVAVNIPSAKTFTYSVPGEMEDALAIGKRVLVPFGRRKVTGYVTEIKDLSEREHLKDIIEILDKRPLFTKEDLNFYQWVSNYYMHPLGKTLREILPGGIDVRSHIWIFPGVDGKEGGVKKISPAQRKIIGILENFHAGISLKNLKEKLGRGNIGEDLKTLQESGLLRMEDKLRKAEVRVKKECVVRLASNRSANAKLTEKQERIIELLRGKGEVPLSALRGEVKDIRSTIKRMEKRGLLSLSEQEVLRSPDKPCDIGVAGGDIHLNSEQKAALEEIIEGIISKRYQPYLLHGVTGSGKTEVYLRAIEKVLDLKGSAIFLVPEIALTPQLISRIKEKFDDDIIAILHSGIGKSSKYDEWRRAERGDAKIIIGARSAIFAPVKNLRLIIVDEEHDASYKQDERLTYNARDCAMVKARLSSAAVILGSATPGLQTYFNIQEKDITHLTLAKRVVDRPLPEIEIIDMKDEREERGNLSVLSKKLKAAIHDTLASKKQTLLFLNRRGFNTFLVCMDCGYIFKCLNCSVSMTHHMSDGTMRCHYCDYSLKAPPLCPECGGSNIRNHGVGTEKLQVEIETLFPQARVVRMDSDSMSKRGAYERTLRELDRGTIDILVGTQMIAKGHDFPNVTLVGIVSADTSLNIPDFRASERTFQIITQVSGRGGRGDFPGRVIIQTLNPEQYAITYARDHNYLGFYNEEMATRRELSYPPFSRMVKFRISSTKEDRAKKCAALLGEIARKIAQNYNITVMGPAEAPIAKIKGRYRWHMLLRGKDVKKLHALSGIILEQVGKSDAEIRLDVDPLNFM